MKLNKSFSEDRLENAGRDYNDGMKIANHTSDQSEGFQNESNYDLLNDKVYVPTHSDANHKREEPLDISKQIPADPNTVRALFALFRRTCEGLCTT